MSYPHFTKYIALYLPQFHAIKENDEWWGEGFTEWTNVKPAKPLFEGHYQPHVPHDDIGYYDLSDVGVMIKQSKMAKEYGIYGFAYYYYWFNGKTLLEKPLQNMLNEKMVDIPFCLFWANHNWTRSWDGGNKEILLEQTYDETAYERFIDDLQPYFLDERYIKIDNKPVLIVYRANDIPNSKKVTELWRKYAKEKYGCGIYIVCCHLIDNIAPANFGYDAALELSPNWYSIKKWGGAMFEKAAPKKYFDMPMEFVDYFRNIFSHILRPEVNYKLFRCVYPTWDNTARRKKKNPKVILNFTIERFKKFLAEMSLISVKSLPLKERFLFIDAWNEWAEGCHLEPCKKYGYQFLETCRQVSKMTIDELQANKFDEKIKRQNDRFINGYSVYVFHFLKIPFLKLRYRDESVRNKIKFYFLKIPVVKLKRY
jgi:lipopolysaccharide biosynthesis protein